MWFSCTKNCSFPKLTVQKQDTAKIMKRMPYSVSNVKLGLSVTKCGLFADYQLLWLAASPDGLVVDVATLEVKSSITGKDMSPEELVKKKKKG